MCTRGQEAMNSSKRRHLLQTAVLMTAGMGAYRPGEAQTPARTPFGVPPTLIPIAGTGDVFPVRRIYCIGRNYAAHAREMGSDPTREPPFFFQKPTDAIQTPPPGVTLQH